MYFLSRFICEEMTIYKCMNIFRTALSPQAPLNIITIISVSRATGEKIKRELLFSSKL